MQSFEDVANSLGQLVVQISANAVRSNELAKSIQETYGTTPPRDEEDSESPA